MEEELDWLFPLSIRMAPRRRNREAWPVRTKKSGGISPSGNGDIGWSIDGSGCSNEGGSKWKGET